MNKLKRSVALLGRALALGSGLVFLASCAGGNPNAGGGTKSGGGGTTPVSNTAPLQVNLGPTNNIVNGLYTDVTVCVPGTTNCQTIHDIEVDTGSEGLRLIASQVNLTFPAVNDSNGNPLGNCVTFADNSYTWGPVVSADVQMAGEKASSVPIQISGATNFPGAPTSCNTGGTANNTVAALGANGLLGVGVFRQDCGQACAGSTSSVPKIYFSCAGVGCSVTSVPVEKQLQNPVWLFPQDNNGLLISLPSIPDSGAPTASGSMIFGIGTQSNNGLGSAQVYTTDSVGNFTTTFQGGTYSGSFLDTGSNGLYFLSPNTIGLPACSGGNSAFSCPASIVSFNATNTGANGRSGPVSFKIANAITLFNSGNSAFSDLGGPDTGEFDWGLPFFFGRNVFIGIEGQTSSAGIGPLWAY